MATVGVKVELEGAKAFSDGMKNLSSQTKLFDTEIKNIQKSMSKSAFQKSIQEGEALKGKLSALQKESGMLKTRISEMTAAYGENDTRVIQLKQKYEALQGQIERTEQAIKSNGGTFGAIGKEFEAIGQKCQDLGSKISSVGDSLTKNVTGPIVALGAASVAAFKDVDNAMDTIIKKTGATGQELQDMEDIAKNIATTIPVSFSDTAAAVGEVNTRFGSTGEELESLSTLFVEFAKLNNVDVSSSIDNVQKALSAYGQGSAYADEYLDRLNLTAQQTGVDVNKLTSGIISNSTAFQELGLNIDEATVFMGQLEKSGANSETVLNGMRKALKNAAKEGKPLDVALAELQDTIENGTDSMDGLNAAYDIFGKSGDQIYGAIQAGTINFKDLATSVDDASGSIENTFGATNDPLNQFTVNMNKLKLLGADVANSMMPAITKVMEQLGNILESLSEKWNSLDSGTQEAILKAALIIAAVGPVISIIGKVVSTVGMISSAISTIIPIISSAAAVMTGTVLPAIGAVLAPLAPFIAIAAGIAAAIALIVLWFQNWGSISDWISEKIANLKDYLIEHFGVVGEMIAGKIEFIWTIIKTHLDIIHIAIETVIEVIKALFSGNFDQIGEIVNRGWTRIKESFSGGVNKCKSIISDMLTSIMSSFKSLISGAVTWGKDMIQSFIDGILAKWEDLKNTVKGVADSVKDFLGFSEPKKGPLSNFHTYGPDMMMNYAEGIKSAQYLVKDAVQGVALDVASTINSPLTSEEMYDAIRQGASDSTTKIILNDRELTRALAGMGVAFNG